jgi:hypothetical protein
MSITNGSATAQMMRYRSSARPTKVAAFRTLRTAYSSRRAAGGSIPGFREDPDHLPVRGDVPTPWWLRAAWRRVRLIAR